MLLQPEVRVTDRENPPWCYKLQQLWSWSLIRTYRLAGARNAESCFMNPLSDKSLANYYPFWNVGILACCADRSTAAPRKGRLRANKMGIPRERCFSAEVPPVSQSMFPTLCVDVELSNGLMGKVGPYLPGQQEWTCHSRVCSQNRQEMKCALFAQSTRIRGLITLLSPVAAHGMPKDGPIGCQKMAMLRWTATGPHQLYRSTFEARPMPQLLKLLKLCQMDRMQVFSEVLFVEIEIVIAFSLTLTTMEVDSRENTRKLGIGTSNFTFSFSRANSSVETRIRLATGVELRSMLRKQFPEHWRIPYSESLRPAPGVGVLAKSIYESWADPHELWGGSSWNTTVIDSKRSPQIYQPVRWNICGFLLHDCYGNRSFASVLDEIYRESNGSRAARRQVRGNLHIWHHDIPWFARHGDVDRSRAPRKAELWAERRIVPVKPKLLQGTHGTLRFLVPPTVELSFFNRHPSPLSSPFQSLEAGAQLRESLGARTSCGGFCKGSEGQHHVRWGDDGCSPEIWTRSISGNLRKDAACFDDCFGHPLFISGFWRFHCTWWGDSAFGKRTACKLAPFWPSKWTFYILFWLMIWIHDNSCGFEHEVSSNFGTMKVAVAVQTSSRPLPALPKPQAGMRRRTAGRESPKQGKACGVALKWSGILPITHHLI